MAECEHKHADFDDERSKWRCCDCGALFSKHAPSAKDIAYAQAHAERLGLGPQRQ